MSDNDKQRTPYHEVKAIKARPGVKLIQEKLTTVARHAWPGCRLHFSLDKPRLPGRSTARDDNAPWHWNVCVILCVENMGGIGMAIMEPVADRVPVDKLGSQKVKADLVKRVAKARKESRK